MFKEALRKAAESAEARRAMWDQPALPTGGGEEMTIGQGVTLVIGAVVLAALLYWSTL